MVSHFRPEFIPFEPEFVPFFPSSLSCVLSHKYVFLYIFQVYLKYSFHIHLHYFIVFTCD